MPKPILVLRQGASRSLEPTLCSPYRRRAIVLMYYFPLLYMCGFT